MIVVNVVTVVLYFTIGIFCTCSRVEAKKSEVFTYIYADIMLIMVDSVIVVLVIVIDCRIFSVVILRIDGILIFSEGYWEIVPRDGTSSQESEKSN